MVKCRINNVEYIVNDGFILKDKYTEELDNGIITIPFSDKLDLSPFDFVEIEDERFGIKYFLIDTWTEDIVSFDPLKYNYNISLISETIKLQRVVMPNIAITQRLNSDSKNIYDMLYRYHSLYIETQYPELYLSTNLKALVNREICPEILFNRPTAFEVFNTLLAKKNSIVKINNHEINYIRLDKYGKEIDASKLYYVSDTQNIEEYANRLDLQIENGISDINNVYTINGLRIRGGEGDAVLSDDNMSIVLDKPIYDLDKIYISFPTEDDAGNERVYEFDMTPHVVEKSIYDTCLTSDISGIVHNEYDRDGNIVKRYKRNCLYYVRGSNIIEGLSYSDKRLVSDSRVAIYNIILSLCTKYGLDVYLMPDFGEELVKSNISFRIIYKTSDSYRTNVEKENKYNATLIDNQTETQIDSNNFGKVEKDKLNRLGNKSKIITATYYKDEIIPELGDYIGDYVLAEREIVYYDDYAIFKGYLYKDYVRKNMFYGLNSRKRSTQISAESVVRNDIVNYDLYFDLERQHDANNFDELKRYILMPLILSSSYYAKVLFEGAPYYEFPRYTFISIKGTDDKYVIPNYGFIMLTPSTYCSGNSNIIHFQFKDNVSAGMKLTDEVDISGVVGGRKQEMVKYVDNFGEFKSIEISFYTNIPDNMTSKYIVDKNISENLPSLSRGDANTISLNSNRIINTGSLELWKDSRETTAISVNFNYKDSPNVIIGSFAGNTGVVYHNPMRENIGICYSLDYEYEKGDQYGVGNIVSDESVVIDCTNADKWLDSLYDREDFNFAEYEVDNIKLNLNNVDTSQWKSWGIIDTETNDLILGINKGKEKTIPTNIYLKCRKKNY